MQKTCHLVDDFLAGNLSREDDDAFRQHLGDCLDCQKEVEADEQLDELATATTWRLPSPPDVLHTIERNVHRQIQTRQWMQYGSTVAAMFLIGLTVVLVARRNHPVELTRTPAPDAGSPVAKAELNPASAAIDRPIVTVESPHHLAVPVESSNPNVTIIWLHPTVEAVSDSESEPSSATGRPHDFIARRF